MDIREPEIKKDEILILNDQDFCRENICIVTGCGTGIGRATAIAAAANNLFKNRPHPEQGDDDPH